jgi:hypothetical protein
MADNLRTQPKYYWKYIYKFKDNYHFVSPLKIGENIITEPQCTAEAFADHFCSVLILRFLSLFQTTLLELCPIL